MNRIFRESRIPKVIVDPDDTPAKHDSLRKRKEERGWDVGNRKRYITTRRLEQWLISDWNHKRRHMGLKDLDFMPVRSGLFYSIRLGGVWVAADWWLRYFEIDENVNTLRLEYLLKDLNEKLLPVLPRGTKVFNTMPRENEYIKGSLNDKNTFTDKDRKRIWQTNPIWMNWEKINYKT